MSDTTTQLYPLLQSILSARGLQLKGIYTNRDAAGIFGVSVRTIQEHAANGELRARDLLGRGRFLAQDLEDYLERSARGTK